MNRLKKLQSKIRDQLRGRPMRRCGEARRRLLMEELEPRVVMANYVLSGTAGADVLLLRRNPNNAALAQVQVNGVTLFNAPVVAGDTVTLNGLAGNDTINIEHTFAGVPVTANGGNDNDTVNVSPTSRFLDNIDG